MNYLFFDCEFSNCFNSIEKICEVGYIITDSSFNVLTKRDILMNPGRDGRFFLKGRNERGDCVLSHTEKEYLSSPLYPRYYGELKNVLTRPNQIIFGFAVQTDMKAIDINNRRYGLKPFDILAYDIQKIYKKYKKDKSPKLSLDYALEQLATEEEMKNFVKHNPTSDAYASMLVLKNICLRQNEKLKTLLKKNKDLKFSSLEESKKRREKQKEKLLLEKKLLAYKYYYGKVIFHSERLALHNQSFTLSSKMMKDLDTAIKTAKNIYKNGGVVRKLVSNPDYLVVTDNKEIERLSQLEKYKRIKMMTFEKLKSLIGEQYISIPNKKPCL